MPPPLAMNRIPVLLTAFLFLVSLSTLQAETPPFPAGIDHRPWDRLLKTYVDERGLVDYAGWHANAGDRAALDRYIAQFAPASKTPATGDDAIASLINAYNAITIAWILDNYPTPSIRKTDDPWDVERWQLGGERVSLDDIEHVFLRPEISWAVHSVVVCAARSCPPLRREAFTANNWYALMEDSYRRWLARDDLNRFLPEKNTVRLSKIFDWYEEDFTGEHTIPAVLRRYAPERYEAFLKGDFKIRFLDYHWGLNAQSDLGKDYDHGWFF
ncbi:MAG: DUF547 domain-containing protein [Opitutales bacterium]